MERKLFSVKEIADGLGRSERYVWAMRHRGFRMTAGRATIDAALAFLASCPHPCGAETDAHASEDPPESA